ncbi:hypothetical protein RRG08_044569 [Elysia crispata]|uniref:Plethodontid modulating factor n=1 Tax=Elysia crispata TaxID=231223 RepID=A0AAE1DLQ6_9GAST|nr:hypothetical protein RRG08_044569 [Elysia crispata]
MKTWVLLVIFLGVTAVVAEESDFEECRSSWCTPSAVHRHNLYGKEVCCSDTDHIYMLLINVREGYKKVDKCYCRIDYPIKLG